LRDGKKKNNTDNYFGYLPAGRGRRETQVYRLDSLIGRPVPLRLHAGRYYTFGCFRCAGQWQALSTPSSFLFLLPSLYSLPSHTLHEKKPYTHTDTHTHTHHNVIADVLYGSRYRHTKNIFSIESSQMCNVVVRDFRVRAFFILSACCAHHVTHSSDFLPLF
jgi:hypothetical protein